VSEGEAQPKVLTRDGDLGPRAGPGRHLLAEAGGALLWTHADRILTSLLRLTGALPPADR
jgi:hypothetical protein